MKKAIPFSLMFLLLVALNSNSQTTSNPDSLKSSLENSNLEAQTKNQLAQAEYYSRQPNSQNNTWITVLGVLVAGLVSFGSAVYVSIRNNRNEREKYINTLKEEHLKATRVAAAELIKKTAQGFHSLTWILWIAKNTPNLFDIKCVQDHDKVMNKLYAEIAGAQVMLSAYSRALYENTEDLVRRLYKDDARVGRMSLGLHDPATKSSTIVELGNLWQEVYDFSTSIPKRFSEKLEDQIPMPQNLPQA